MSSERIMNLLVTIPAESRRMNVGKDVIRILGSPAYICILQRKDRQSIAITPCAAEHPMSFKVPDRLLTDGQCRMRINTGIVKFMDVLLSSSRAATEKKKILEEEFGVAMNEDLEREVLVMCNLSQGVKAEGREEGISIGEMRMLVQLVRDGDLKMERAAEKAKMTVEQFKKVMENTPLQAV